MMSEWEEFRLGDIATLKYGKMPKKALVANDGYPIYSGYGYTGYYPEWNCPKGSLIVVARGVGGTGDVKICKDDCYLTNLSILIDLDNRKALNNFIYYRYLVDNLRYLDSGSAQSQITIADLQEIFILLPSLDEQQAITAVLASLDDKIDLLHRQNKTLEALAQTLFRHWFIDGADDDWETVTVGEFAQLNASTVQKGYEHKQIEYLDTGSITEGKISGFQQYALKDAPSRARRLVKHNDVIYSTVRPNQKHYGLVKKPQRNLVVSTGFCVLTCDKIDPHFVYILLTRPDMIEYLHSIAEGSTSAYPSLKPSDIASVEFQMPPKDKLDEFSILAQNFWAKIDQNDNQIRTLEKLRDAFLPKLMSGEVRVSDGLLLQPARTDKVPGLFEKLGVFEYPIVDSDPVEYVELPDEWLAIPETIYQLEQQPFSPTIGQTIFQKISFVLTDEGIHTGFEFSPGDYGPYSANAEKALLALELAGFVQQQQSGRSMKEILVQQQYLSQRETLADRLAQFKPMINRTVGLFKFIKNTNHAEEVGSILFAARQLEQKHGRHHILRQEIIDFLIEWKSHWNKSGKLRSINKSIDGLIKMDFISID